MPPLSIEWHFIPEKEKKTTISIEFWVVSTHAVKIVYIYIYIYGLKKLEKQCLKCV